MLRVRRRGGKPPPLAEPMRKSVVGRPSAAGYAPAPELARSLRKAPRDQILTACLANSFQLPSCFSHTIRMPIFTSLTLPSLSL
jgi:hypothetical protein